MFIEEERARRAEAEINNYGGLGRAMQAAAEAAKVANNGKAEQEEDVTWKFADTVVFESRRTKGLEFEGTLAKDLKAHDKTDAEIIALCDDKWGMQWVVKNKEDVLKKSIAALIVLMTATNSEMRECVANLFQRFYTGQGKVNENDEILKKTVAAHPAVQDYISTTKELIRTKLWSDACQGIITHLDFDKSVKWWDLAKVKKDYKIDGTDEDPIYDNDKVLDNLPLYARFQDLKYPKFISGGDLTNGLSLAIHDIWAVEIEILNYTLNYSKKSYTGTYRLTIHDNFGLDDGDMQIDPETRDGSKYKKYLAHITDPAYYGMFQAWYVLQHRTHDLDQGTYIPFINTITMDSDFSGIVPAKWHGAMEEGVRKSRGY